MPFHEHIESVTDAILDCSQECIRGRQICCAPFTILFMAGGEQLGQVPVEEIGEGVMRSYDLRF